VEINVVLEKLVAATDIAQKTQLKKGKCARLIQQISIATNTGKYIRSDAQN